MAIADSGQYFPYNNRLLLNIVNKNKTNFYEFTGI